MLENAWRPLGIFWMGNLRKRLAAAKCFLDKKCMVAAKCFLDAKS
jgi:hypothetical protein